MGDYDVLCVMSEALWLGRVHSFIAQPDWVETHIINIPWEWPEGPLEASF